MVFGHERRGGAFASFDGRSTYSASASASLTSLGLPPGANGNGNASLRPGLAETRRYSDFGVVGSVPRPSPLRGDIGNGNGKEKEKGKDPERPFGVFLFLGPNGVGKTRLAQEVAAYLFGEDDELIRLGLAGRTAREMGHLPISGPGGSLEQLAPLPIERRIYVHVNNTNPILLEDAPERRTVEEHGMEVAVDGLELEV